MQNKSISNNRKALILLFSILFPLGFSAHAGVATEIAERLIRLVPSLSERPTSNAVRDAMKEPEESKNALSPTKTELPTLVNLITLKGRYECKGSLVISAKDSKIEVPLSATLSTYSRSKNDPSIDTRVSYSINTKDGLVEDSVRMKHTRGTSVPLSISDEESRIDISWDHLPNSISKNKPKKVGSFIETFPDGRTQSGLIIWSKKGNEDAFCETFKVNKGFDAGSYTRDCIWDVRERGFSLTSEFSAIKDRPAGSIALQCS